MLRTLIVLPDGAELFSGGPGAAVANARLVRSCNSGSQLTLGSVCPAEFSCTLTEAAGVRVAQGDELIVYHVDDMGNRKKMGVFITQSTLRKGIATLEITAADKLILLEKDLTDWLEEREMWPYDLATFTAMACGECGLRLAKQDLLNGSYPVEQFLAQGLTGKQLMQWVGQITGTFCRTNPDGQVEFAWYAPGERVIIGPTAPGPCWSWEEGHLKINADTIRVEDDYFGDVYLATEFAKFTYREPGNLTVEPGLPASLFYYRGSLSRSAEPVDPVQRVILRRSSADVGISWPNTTRDDLNTYVMSGNYLLSATQSQDTRTVAQRLYDRLSQVRYTPCSLEIPASWAVEPGQILPLTDTAGQEITLYVMRTECNGSRVKVQSVGTPRREMLAAVSGTRYEGLSGKVLELRTDVEGLSLQTTDTAGRLTELEVSVEGLRTRASRQETVDGGVQDRLATLEQTADSLDISVKNIRKTGEERVATAAGYSFTDRGLTVSAQGQQTQTLVDHSGMYVSRDGENVLQINELGVETEDIRVRNYLVIGLHSRFEDYGDGTACFYI